MRSVISPALGMIVFACCSKEEISADEPSGPAADAGVFGFVVGERRIVGEVDRRAVPESASIRTSQ